MITPELGLPPVGYSITEVERILGIPPKTGYRLVKDGTLDAFVDSTSQLKVHQFELWRHLRKLEE